VVVNVRGVQRPGPVYYYYSSLFSLSLSPSSPITTSRSQRHSRFVHQHHCEGEVVPLTRT
jgi:hypothetical protein